MLLYQIKLEHYRAHLFSVRMVIPAQSAPVRRLSLPAWIPGSYMIRDFARNLSKVRGFVEHAEIDITPVDKQTWQVAPYQGELTIEYQVYAFDLSVRSAYLDGLFGFFNPSSLCLQVDADDLSPCEISLELPSELAHWQIATGMPQTSGAPWQGQTFVAQSYTELLEYPFLMGELSIVEFTVKDIPHALVFVGQHDADLDRIGRDVSEICRAQIDMFDGTVPFQRYLFLTMVVGDGFGGLEHINSTALLCSRRDLIWNESAAVDKNYQRFLSLCSHEYFHSWNVKAVRPAELTPYQLASEQYTKQLWFYEGMTSYFDDYFVHHAGLIDAQQYLNTLTDTITRVERGQGVQQQSVVESSFYAWTKFYQQDANAANAIVSYYTKGALLALWLDLRLRATTQTSLPELFGQFWQQHYHSQVMTSEDSFVHYLEQRAGHQLATEFSRLVHGVGWVPLTEALAACGVELHMVTSSDDSDSAVGTAATTQPVRLGAKYQANPGDIQLTVVYRGEAAEQAGLCPGDRIIAIDNLASTRTSLNDILIRKRPGQISRLHVFRRDELLELELKWATANPTLRKARVVDSARAARWLRLS